ncbi:hypothetical protein BGZ94_000764 [Podila epigama]|nr:hypothetical protein BGZ94_000764 [Podila epigama]
MTTLTVNQAIKVMEDILLLLAAPPPLVPSSQTIAEGYKDPGQGQGRQRFQAYVEATNISLNKLVDSMLVLDTVDTIPFVEGFIARVYCHLQSAMHQSAYCNKPILGIHLTILDMLISAGHIALYQSQKQYSWKLMRTQVVAPLIVYHQMVDGVINQIPQLLGMMQNSPHSTPDSEKRILASCEIVISSAVMSFLKAIERFDCSATHFAGAVLACTRQIDETLIPQHARLCRTQGSGDVGHFSLVSGIHALLDVLEHLKDAQGIQQAKSILTETISKSDISLWAIQVVQSCPESEESQVCQSFIARVIQQHGLFSMDNSNITSLNGDQMPSLACLNRLNLNHLLTNVKLCDATLNENLDILASQEARRIAIALLYIKAISTECITALGKQPDTDLNPLVQQRIMEGLKTCLDAPDSISVKVLENLYNTLKTRVAMKDAAMTEISSFRKVCHVVQCSALWTPSLYSTALLNPSDLMMTQSRFMRDVLYMTLATLAQETFMTAEDGSLSLLDKEPLLASCLWDCIQEHMDHCILPQNASPPSSSLAAQAPRLGLKFVIASMDLLLADQRRTESVTWFGPECLALMGNYIIELHKTTQTERFTQTTEHLRSMDLIIKILRQMLVFLKDRSQEVTQDWELWSQIDMEIDVMLDLFRQEIITTVENHLVWKYISDFGFILGIIFDIEHPLLPFNEVTRSGNPHNVQLRPSKGLFLKDKRFVHWAQFKILHPANRILMGSLVHRWVTELTQLSTINETTHSAMHQAAAVGTLFRMRLDQAGRDIYAVANLHYLISVIDEPTTTVVPSSTVVINWLQEFLQDPVAITFDRLFRHYVSQAPS